jgi:cell division protein FtsB
MTPETPPEATPKRRARPLSGVQVMFAVILGMGLMLAINFSSRVTADRQLAAVLNAVEREIETLRREQGKLIEQLEYVKSDAYVETWARSNGRMVREGEVLVLVSPVGDPAPAPVVVMPPISEANQPQAVPAWHLWWSLFFDTPPPSF